MKNLTVAVALLFTASALAQEIGTEISSPDRSTGQPNNPWAAPPPPPKNEPGAAAAPQPGARPADANGKVAAGAGAFGIHAGFGATASLPVVPSATTAGSTVSAPKVGVTLFAGDNFALEADLGFGLGIINSSMLLATGVSVAADIYFRPPTVALRPFFTVGAGFDLYLLGSTATVGVNAQAGVGATYFLSPSFGLSGKLLVGAPLLFGNNVVVGIFTVSPGVTAHWFF